MSKIKFAVIGLGNMGRDTIVHIMPNYADEIELVAICDSNTSALEKMAQIYPNVQCFTEYKRVFQEAAVDLVYIAVPPSMHYEVAMAAIENNVHVFCEKPLANSLPEAKALLDAAVERAIVHAIHFSFPLEPAVLTLKRLLAERSIGEIGRMELLLQFPEWPRSWQNNRWVATRQEGGFLLEVGVHWIHMIQTLFGSITNVESHVTFPADAQTCESSVKAMLTLHNGIHVEVAGSVGQVDTERVSLLVYGSDGTIALENWEQLLMGKPGREMRPVEADETESKLPILKQVIDRVRGEQSFYYDFYDGYNVQAILEALRQGREESK
ncbi:oxidoreductase domain protein [Paenibacillus curdlanolyticus YK9]|uniref:Oxidoreductase domain protein n=1 Tax=Paenibacillus curdlanolyticus YK9 TaxID=717606 RepID=E0I9L4_9BACL|nr:Gfo/Idh/MocA family oxidoreductase [Paenibacillus curdlanolyticus]EFM11098.1 oxidoreductase domain protein [Paenibacillus curdlanolyticus YK9]